MVVKKYQYVNELIHAYVRLSTVNRNMGEGAPDFMEIFFFNLVLLSNVLQQFTTFQYRGV